MQYMSDTLSVKLMEAHPFPDADWAHRGAPKEYPTEHTFAFRSPETKRDM
jgi:hypothetical protein